MLAADQAQVLRPDLLSQLSNELLSIIVSFCRQEDLPSLARTCRRLHSHAFPALYRTITINGETRASVFTILSYKYDLRRMLKTTVGVGGEILSYLRLFHEIFPRQCPLPKQSQLSNC